MQSSGRTRGKPERPDRHVRTLNAGQEFLGIDLDPAANAANAPVISSRGSAVTVRVIPTNEERMIARHTIALLGLRQDNSVAEGIHV